MNRFLFSFLVLSVLATDAVASRARVSALQSLHLLDTELVHYFPSKLIEIPDYISFQTGPTVVGSRYSDRAAFSFKKDFNVEQSDFYSLGASIGRSSDLIDAVREKANSILLTNYELTANPVDINYTVKARGNTYSLGFSYADKDDKLNSISNRGATMNLGYRIDDFTFSSNVGLYNYVEDLATTSTLGVNQSFNGRMLFELDDIYILLDVSSSQVKKYISKVENTHLEFLSYKMGLVKNDFNGEDTFFYRFDLSTDQVKNRTTNTASRSISLPVTFGFETLLNELFILRSSVQQIVGVYKTNDYEIGPNTTTAAVGLGFKINKLAIDGTFQGLIGSAATQKIDANQFLSETSITYWF